MHCRYRYAELFTATHVLKWEFSQIIHGRDGFPPPLPIPPRNYRFCNCVLIREIEPSLLLVFCFLFWGFFFHTNLPIYVYIWDVFDIIHHVKNL